MASRSTSNPGSTIVLARMRPVPPVLVYDEQVTIGEWDVHLFDCFLDLVPNCVMSFWCTWLSLAQIVTRIGLLTSRTALLVFGSMFVLNVCTAFVSYWYTDRIYEDSHNDSIDWAGPNVTHAFRLDGAAFPVFCYWLHRILVGLFCVMASIVRFQVRKRFDIPGNPCTDLLLSVCCHCCVAAQMASHVKSYQPGDCKLTMPDQLPPYVA